MFLRFFVGWPSVPHSCVSHGIFSTSLTPSCSHGAHADILFVLQRDSQTLAQALGMTHDEVSRGKCLMKWGRGWRRADSLVAISPTSQDTNTRVRSNTWSGLKNVFANTCQQSTEKSPNPDPLMQRQPEKIDRTNNEWIEGRCAGDGKKEACFSSFAVPGQQWNKWRKPTKEEDAPPAANGGGEEGKW